MKRKNIAVCVTGYNYNYESRIVKGISDRCSELDINLLIFAPLICRHPINLNKMLPDSVVKGETEIFNLINYDILDGIIILGEAIVDEKVIYKVAAKAAEKNIPVINVSDPPHKLMGNVTLSDEKAMEYVIRHLVEVHGLTKINFIGGYPGNLQTEQRLAAYKKVLTEKNIPVEESRIAYGEFWVKSIECVKEFIASGDIPQAIVCANDIMAIFCMDYLQRNGYRIPEDIVVTGYDGLDDCETYKPTITSVRKAYETSGRKAMEMMEQFWQGNMSADSVDVESELLIMQSCGCVPKNDKKVFDYYEERYGSESITLEFNSFIHDMNVDFSEVKNSEELFENASYSANMFKLKRLFVCICSNIEQGTERLGEETLASGFRGISPEMVNMFSYGSNASVGKHFPVEKLVPEDILSGNKATVFAFSPLYFKDDFLGYIAYEPSGFEGHGSNFATWLMTLSNNTGSYYMNKKLELVVEQLENLNVRDPLTGLYNRRGMSKYGIDLLNNAKEEDTYITVVCSDIDNLKPINDLYGHEAGDNAIVQIAKAIDKSMPVGTVSVRTGGDEFCSILENRSDEEIKDIISQIEGILKDYNCSSGLPYKVGCSCGYYRMKAAQVESIEKIAAFADEEMYKEKVRKKAMRKM